jgi:outer membrane murein-binding lipoprotein Lpp
MKALAAIAAAMLVTGCASVQEVKQANVHMSSYQLCMKLAANPLAMDNIRQGWRELIQERGDSCGPYAAEMEMANARANANISGLAASLSAPRPMAPSPQQVQGRGFLKVQFVQGFNRICVYDDLGSAVHVTIPSTSICPLSR